MGIMAINNAIKIPKSAELVASAAPVFLDVFKDSLGIYHYYYYSANDSAMVYSSSTSSDGTNLSAPVVVTIQRTTIKTHGGVTYTQTGTKNNISHGGSHIKGFIKDDKIYIGYKLGSTSGNNNDYFFGLPRGFYLCENTSNYSHFTIVNEIFYPIGSEDGVHALTYITDPTTTYFLYGRLRASTSNNWQPPNPVGASYEINPNIYNDARAGEDPRTGANKIDYTTDIWYDKRGIRIFTSTSITGTFDDLYYIDVNNRRAIDPKNLFTDYDTNSIRVDLYGGKAIKYENYLLYFVNCFLKDQNRYPTLRKDRRTGQGPIHPKLLISKDGINFKVTDEDVNIVDTSAQSLNREWYTPTWDGGTTLVPDSFGDNSNIPSYTGINETGQLYANSVWEDADGEWIYISVNDQRNPHYSSQSDYSESWYLTGVGGSYNLTGSIPNVDITGSLTIDYEDVQDNVKWVHFTEFKSRGTDIAGIKVTFADVNANITVNSVTKSVKAHLADIPYDKFPHYRWWKEAYNGTLNSPGGLALFKIRKGRFGSWKSNGAGAYVDTKTITIPANADFIQVNHIGNVGVSVIIIGSPFSIGTVTGDSINSLVNISNYKGQSLKLRFYLLEDNTSELFSFNFVRDINAPVSPLSLIIPEVNQIVPKEWTVFKWTPVGGAVNGTTQYTIGVEGNTNTNTHPKLIRTRTGIDVGTYNTVLTSTSPVSAANSISITIADALVSSDSTQITFRRSAGVSNYKVEFATDNGFSNIIRTENLAQQLTGDKYPIGEQTLDLTQFNFADGTYYWRISATVPGEDTTQRAPTVFGNFTIALGAITIEDWTPIIDSPANNATITKTGNLIIFKDDSVNGSDYDKTGFQFQFSNLANFSTIHNTVFRVKIGRESGNLFTVSVGGMGVAFPLGTTTSRYWRVRAYVDAVNGPFSQWSEIRRVTVTP
jgi:hypothetical protein